MPRSKKDLLGPDDVATVRDVISWAIKRLGCQWPEGDEWKKNSIILSYSGYTVSDLTETIEWCANTGKHPAVPWKIIIWVDACKEDTSPRSQAGDPIQQRLDEIYINATPEMRKRIRAVSGTPDKRAALELLREIQAN